MNQDKIKTRFIFSTGVLIILLVAALLLSGCQILLDVLDPALPPVPTVNTVQPNQLTPDGLIETPGPNNGSEVDESGGLKPTLIRTPSPTPPKELIETPGSNDPGEDIEIPNEKEIVIVNLPIVGAGAPQSPPTFTPTPTKTPTTIPTPKPYVVQEGNPVYLPSFIHPSCDWMGVAGQVFDGSGVVLNMVVKLGGTFNGVPVDKQAATGTAVAFGQGGYEIMIDDEMKASVGTMYVQLFSPAGDPVSKKVFFDTSGKCEEAVVLVNFVKKP